jgi:curved DNA-binding protein CbpA
VSDPYDVLGVARDADTATIKRAYRKRAQRTHPDREGGDEEAFAAAASAYALLSDPKRRLRYDRTGEEKVEVGEQQILQEMAGLIMATIDQAPSVEHHDVLFIARRAVQAKRKELEQQRQSSLRHIEKRERAVKRIQSKRPHDLLLVMLNAQVAKERQERERLNDQFDLINRMLELLDAYSYDVDAAGLYMGFVTSSTA